MNRQGQKLDQTMSPGLDHSDQLGLTRVGLKILRGTRTDLNIFRRYKKYDLPETSSCIVRCIGLHFMQQQCGKMQDRAIRHFVRLVVSWFSILVPGFQMQLTVPSSVTPPKVSSSILIATNFFLFFFPIFSFSSTFFYCIIFDFL